MNNMKKIIITVGPSIVNGCGIKEIDELGDYIYRINASHGELHHIENYIRYIRHEIPNASIMLDLPGNKIRTKNIEDPIVFKANEVLSFHAEQFNFSSFFQHLKKGMIMIANDGLNRFEIIDVNKSKIQVKALEEGDLRNNKGFHTNGISTSLPFLFEKDIQLIELAKKYSLSHIGLSFIRCAEDIKEAMGILGSSSTIQALCKIETKMALENLDSILRLAPTILIDRGDLSADIGLENIPRAIALALKKAGVYKNKVFIATHFLKFMETHPIALLSEACDLYNTLRLDIEGIQLSEETAVGKNPVACLHFINSVWRTIHA